MIALLFLLMGLFIASNFILPLVLIGLACLVALPPVISALVVLAKVGIDLISDVFSYFSKNEPGSAPVAQNSYSKTQQDLVEQGNVQTNFQTEIKEHNSIMDGVTSGLKKLNFFEKALDTVCGKLAGYPEFHLKDSSLHSL